MRLVVDFSAGALSRAGVAAWQRVGVKGAIVQYSERLSRYLAVLDACTLDFVDVYVYLYFPESPWDQTPEERVAEALHLVQGHRVGRVWLDVEDPFDDQTIQGQVNTVAALKRCVQLVERSGYPAGIYSGFWTYIQHTGNSMEFNHLPWWHADYVVWDKPFADLTRMPTELRFRNGSYAGVAAPTIWQWQNTCTLAGVTPSVDLNICADDMAPMEDEMVQHVTISAAERGDAAFRSYLVGASSALGLSSRWVQSDAEFKALAAIGLTLEEVTLEQLMQFHPIPAPLDP